MKCSGRLPCGVQPMIINYAGMLRNDAAMSVAPLSDDKTAVGTEFNWSKKEIAA